MGIKKYAIYIGLLTIFLFLFSCMKNPKSSNNLRKETAIDTILKVANECFNDYLEEEYKKSYCLESKIDFETFSKLEYKDIKLGLKYFNNLEFFRTAPIFDTVELVSFGDSNFYYFIKYRFVSSNRKPCYCAIGEYRKQLNDDYLPIFRILNVGINKNKQFLESLHTDGLVYQRDSINPTYSSKDDTTERHMPLTQCILDRLPLKYK